MPAELRENGWSDARAAGQLPLASSGCCADPLRGRYAELEAVGAAFRRSSGMRATSGMAKFGGDHALPESTILI
jgi:hypothetical protein